MTRIQALYLALAMTSMPALAQQTEDHSQHHPGAGGDERSTDGAAPGSGGMMQMMMRNMPDQCRAVMQKMPSTCMPMMDKMMSGMMGSGGMRSSDIGSGGQAAPLSRSAASSPVSGAHSDHATSGVAEGRGSSSAPHISAFNDAVEKMHEPMMEGVRHENPDVAFVRGMIPHHQAAIDMALVVLKYGKDEKMRKLALDVIREQNREIAEMNEWLRLNVK